MLYSQDLPIAEVLIVLGDDFRYYPIFAHALGGNVNAAIMLSTFMRWQGKQKDPEGWIYKSAAEIEKETGLSRSMQATAITHLAKLNLLRDENRGTPCTKHFLFDWAAVTKLVNDYRRKHNTQAPVPDALVSSDLPEPLIKTMAKKFDERYLGATNGISYEWGKGKDSRNRGKQMRALKDLSEALAKRCAERQQTQAQKQNNGVLPEGWAPRVTELDVLNSWQALLDYLPEYHLQRNLEPHLLYSNFNRIILDLTNANRGQQQSGNGGDKRHARQGAAASAAAAGI